MDPLILSQKSKKWFEAVRNLKDHTDELDLSEQTAIDFLNDAWRTRTFDNDLRREAHEMTQILIQNQKLHAANRKIIEWTKELCSTSDLMYTRDAKTYEEVRSALRKTWQESRPKPAPKPNNTPKPTSGSSPKPEPKPNKNLDPIILSQKAKKWVEALQYLLDNADSLSKSEAEALVFLLWQWNEAQFSAALSAKAKEMAKEVRDCQKLHGANRKIIECTKEICNTAELMYTRDADTFRQVSAAIEKALKENPPRKSESTPKPVPDSTPAKIKVTGVTFSNNDINGKVISHTLPFNTQFVNPTISYTRVSGSGKVFLKYRIYDPNGVILEGNGSPAGFTIQYSFESSSSGTVMLLGYGSSSGSFYKPGTYKFELYEGGERIYSTSFNIPPAIYTTNSNGNSGSSRTNTSTSSGSGKSSGGSKGKSKVTKFLVYLFIIVFWGWVLYTCSGGGNGETMYSVGDVHLVDSKGNPITTIAGPVEVEVLDIDDGMAKIKANGKEGYVDAKYVVTSDEAERLDYVINKNKSLDTDFGRKAIHDFLTNNPSIVNNPGNWRIYNTTETTFPKAVMQPKPAKSDVQEVLAFVVASEKRYQRGVYHLMKNGDIVRVMNQQVPVGDLLSSLSYIPSTGKYDIHYAKDNKIVSPAKTKPTDSNPFVITDISFVTVDGNTGKTISQKVTKESQYVAPVISYVAEPNVSIKNFLIKVFDPSGKLIKENTSPEDGTYKSVIEHWQIKPKGQLTLLGWRNPDKAVPWDGPGYRMEIWDDTGMLASGTVPVK